MKVYRIKRVDGKRANLRYAYSHSDNDLDELFPAAEFCPALVSGLWQFSVFYLYLILPMNWVTSNVSNVILNQMLSLLQSGFPLNQASNMIRRDFANLKLQGQFSAFSCRLHKGERVGSCISNALTFLPLFIRCALEEVDSGAQLIDMLQHTADTQKDVVMLKSRIVLQLLIFLPLLLGLVLWLMLEANLYGRSWLQAYRYVLGIEPPIMVVSFLSVFRADISTWSIWFGAIFVLAVGVYFLFKVDKMKYMKDRFVLSIPVLRSFIRIPLAHHVLTVIHLYASYGFDIYQSIVRSIPIVHNKIIAVELKRLVARLDNGENFASCFADLSLFTPIEKSTFMSALKTRSMSGGLSVLQNTLLRRYRVLIHFAEFLIRFLFIAAIVVLLMWYAGVNFYLNADFPS